MSHPDRIRQLAERLTARRTRTSITAEAAVIAAQALRFYADMLDRPPSADELNRAFVVQVVDPTGYVEEVLAKCGHAIVARAAFAEACKHRPGRTVELRHGTRVLQCSADTSDKCHGGE